MYGNIPLGDSTSHYIKHIKMHSNLEFKIMYLSSENCCEDFYDELQNYLATLI